MHLLTTLLKPLIESLPEPSNLYTTHCHPIHHASLHHIPVHSAFIYIVLLMDEGLLTSPHSKFYPITVLKINLTYQKVPKTTLQHVPKSSTLCTLCTMHPLYCAPYTPYTMHHLQHTLCTLCTMHPKRQLTASFTPFQIPFNHYIVN